MQGKLQKPPILIRQGGLNLGTKGELTYLRQDAPEELKRVLAVLCECDQLKNLTNAFDGMFTYLETYWRSRENFPQETAELYGQYLALRSLNPKEADLATLAETEAMFKTLGKETYRHVFDRLRFIIENSSGHLSEDTPIIDLESMLLRANHFFEEEPQHPTEATRPFIANVDYEARTITIRATQAIAEHLEDNPLVKAEGHYAVFKPTGEPWYEEIGPLSAYRRNIALFHTLEGSLWLDNDCVHTKKAKQGKPQSTRERFTQWASKQMQEQANPYVRRAVHTIAQMQGWEFRYGTLHPRKEKDNETLLVAYHHKMVPYALPQSWQIIDAQTGMVH